jgi:hypothetical protein
LDTPTARARSSNQDYARLNDDVRRLLDFKREHVRGRSRTPCPECATAIDVQANKCPQCGSDVAEHTANVRHHLAELQQTTAEIEGLHRRYMEYREEEAAVQPVVERIRRAVTSPTLSLGLKTLVPAYSLFFAFIVTLRILDRAPLFWIGSIAGGILAYTVLKRLPYRHFVTVELYRAILVVGLLVIMSSAVFVPSGSASFFSNRVEVVRPAANIRESASTDARIVTTARNGDKLTVLDRQGEWLRVRTESGTTGCLHRSLVRD